MQVSYLRFWLIITLLSSLSAPIQAQKNTEERYNFEFRGKELTDALDIISRTVDINLVYDPKLVTNHIVYNRIKNQPFPKLLGSILKEFNLDYLMLSTGTYVIVETIRQQNIAGIYRGKITDAETGRPLPHATVLLADAAGGTTSNANGLFSMPELQEGSYTIVFSYLGYKPVQKEIKISSGQTLEQDIRLQPKRLTVSPLIVESHKNRISHLSKNNTITSNTKLEEVTESQSPLQSLSLFSGIQYGLPMSSLHLQGGQRSEHLITLDGVPVYNTFNIGRLFSIFSPYAINEITVHKSGFGVEHGSQISGLVAFDHTLSDSKTNTTLLQTNPLSANIRGQYHIPVGKNDIQIMTAFRSSLWDIYKEPNMKEALNEWNFIDPLITNQLKDFEADTRLFSPQNQRSDIQFFDLHTAAKYKINPYQTISGSLYLGRNSLETQLLNRAPASVDVPRFLVANDDYQWNNTALQLSWRAMLSPRLDLNTQIAYSSGSLDHSFTLANTNVVSGFNTSDLAFLDPDQSDELFRLPTQIEGNTITNTIINSTASYQFSPTFTLLGGFKTQFLQSDVQISDNFFQPALNQQESTIISGYLKAEQSINEHWLLTFGSRFTHQNTQNKLLAEPRVSLQFDGESFGTGHWSAQLSGGLFRQFISRQEITNVAPSSVIPSLSVWSHTGELNQPKAYHLAGSMIFQLDEDTNISLEGFSKWQPDAIITSYRALNESTANSIAPNEVGAFAESTSMQSSGFGFRVNRLFSEQKLRLITGYDFSSVNVDFSSQFGKTITAPWNQPHRAQFKALWNPTSNIHILAAWHGIWGRKWAFRPAYYNFLLFQETNLPNDISFGSPGDDALSPLRQTDLTFVYRPEMSSTDTDIEFRIKLINIFNRRNELDRSLIPQIESPEPGDLQISTRRLPGFYPSLSAQVTF